MSRSKRKTPKIGFACGTNTEYYRDRNRNTRSKNKHLLRNAKTIEELANLIFVQNRRNPSYDSWNKPTDGTYIYQDKTSELYKKLLRK